MIGLKNTKNVSQREENPIENPPVTHPHDVPEKS